MATWRILLLVILSLLALYQIVDLLADLRIGEFSQYAMGYITGKLIVILGLLLIIRLIYLKGKQDSLKK